MLSIKNLCVQVDNKPILKNFTLDVKAGEVSAIMGPNGAGKSTLAHVIAGKDGYDVTEGTVTLNDQNVLDLEPEERSLLGIFLAFQYPMEIPGVGTMTFLRTAYNTHRAHQGKSETDALTFGKLIRQTCDDLSIPHDLLKRPINTGFSGGEKKRAEILQLALLAPTFVVMDETDSGLDIDALQSVAEGVNRLRNKDRAFLIITHYQRLLRFIVPDAVHIMSQGAIAKSGDKTLAEELEAKGYAGIMGS
ncbi:MAG: Fe-S cluster assembly ATPase SufC [Pseudomonadota bacterium]